MSWRDFYWLLKKYNGDLDKATNEEKKSAIKGNPNNPRDARNIAQKYYDKEMQNGKEKNKEKGGQKKIS